MIELYALNIDEFIDEKIFNYFQNLIAKDKLERINKYFFMEDKKRSLYADVLVRFCICKKLNICNSNISFYTNAYGKPYLMNNKEIYFNISHSGKWILLGISSKEIGADIEHITDCDLDIAKRFFATEEFENLKSSPIANRNKLFYQIWTIKESYIKYKGLGLSIPLDSFHCKIMNDTILLSTKQNESLNVRTYPIDNNYLISTCSIEEPAINVSYITLSQIVNANI